MTPSLGQQSRRESKNPSSPHAQEEVQVQDLDLGLERRQSDGKEQLRLVDEPPSSEREYVMVDGHSSELPADEVCPDHGSGRGAIDDIHGIVQP